VIDLYEIPYSPWSEKARWALDHLLAGRALEELVDAPFDWRPGWRYRT